VTSDRPGRYPAADDITWRQARLQLSVWPARLGVAELYRPSAPQSFAPVARNESDSWQYAVVFANVAFVLSLLIAVMARRRSRDARSSVRVQAVNATPRLVPVMVS
jgi:hypothetical protein